METLHAWFDRTEAIKGITVPIMARRATALIGPSGCGKSTFIRCLNRMHEVVRGARVSGRVFLDGQDVYDPAVNPVQLRQAVGMVFQKPNPFPTMSIRENVLAGLRLQKIRSPDMNELVEKALRRAALWEEVKDILSRPGVILSGGQQQRLCIARALALEPEVLLMDEPCSALGPDLRFVTTSLKLVTEIERTADMCVSICERTIELSQEPLPKPVVDLAPMAKAVREMVHEAIEAFAAGDVERAGEVILRDRTVDAHYAQVARKLQEWTADKHVSMSQASRIQAVAKYIERIGDHATNIAEQVVFMIKGKDIRHVSRRAENRHVRPRGILFLCVEEVCVTLPGMVKRETWSLPDRAAVTGSEQQMHDIFVDIRDKIRLRIDELAARMLELR